MIKVFGSKIHLLFNQSWRAVTPVTPPLTLAFWISSIGVSYLVKNSHGRRNQWSAILRSFKWPSCSRLKSRASSRCANQLVSSCDPNSLRICLTSILRYNHWTQNFFPSNSWIITLLIVTSSLTVVTHWIVSNLRRLNNFYSVLCSSILVIDTAVF